MKRLEIKNQELIKDRISQYFQSSKDLKLFYRLHCIFMLIEDKSRSCSEVARMHSTTPQTVVRWIHAFNNTNADIHILKDKDRPGRNARITKSDLNIISDVLKDLPDKYGIIAQKWEGKTLSVFLKQRFNIDLKTRQCQRTMKDLGFANKRGATGLIDLNRYSRNICVNVNNE